VDRFAQEAMKGFKLRGQNNVSDPNSFGGARTYSRSAITMPSLVGLSFHLPPGWTKRWDLCYRQRSAKCQYL